MSLRNILLGLLEKPASGYDLKGEFGASLGHFWAAELAQIYPTLKAMEAEGLVRSRAVPSTRGPARKEYRRTKSGERALEERHERVLLLQVQAQRDDERALFCRKSPPRS